MQGVLRRLSEILARTGHMRVRQAKSRDQDFLIGLFSASRPYLRQLPLPVDMIDVLIEQQHQLQWQSYTTQFPGLQSLLVILQEQPIGRLYLALDADEGSLRVVDVCMAPEHCGKGYGSQLFRSLQMVAKDQGWCLRLSVALQNWRAKKFYGALDFKSCGSSETHQHLVWNEIMCPTN